MADGDDGSAPEPQHLRDEPIERHQLREVLTRPRCCWWPPGDNAERLRSEAAWAHLCGVAPIPASSGKVVRHRLNRGGDRQANHALYRIVMVRLRYHEPTRVYFARRQAEGRTTGEIVRMLKRYVAPEVFKHLPRDLRG